MNTRTTRTEGQLQNLYVLHVHLPLQALYKEKLISKEQFEIRVISKKPVSLEELNLYAISFKAAFQIENMEFENVNALKEFLSKKNDINKLMGNLHKHSSKKKFVLDWDLINLKESKDLFLFIYFLSIDPNSKNLMSNHIFEDVLKCQEFMNFIFFTKSFTNKDLILFKEFKFKYQRLV